MLFGFLSSNTYFCDLFDLQANYRDSKARTIHWPSIAACYDNLYRI
jgi:hypothetical protein